MSQSTSPHLLVESVDGVTIAAIADASLLSEEVIADVDEQLGQLLDSLGPDKVVLSFREVRQMSSSVLAVLVKFARRVGEAGGRLKLCCLDPHLREVFRVSRFDRLFEIYDTESAAIDSF
jgi:anti-anti-sigma factor